MADAIIAVAFALAALWVLRFALCGIRAASWKRVRESIRVLELEHGIGTAPELQPLLHEFLTTDARTRAERRWRTSVG